MNPNYRYSAAPTLTQLSIRPNRAPIPTALLTTLNLPNLVDFEITITATLTGVKAKFEDVAMFLGKHSERLENVRLLGVGWPPLDTTIADGAPSTRTAARFFDAEKPIFPRLKSFMAHPAYIVWLLGLATGAGGGSISSKDCAPSSSWNGSMTRRRTLACASSVSTPTSAPFFPSTGAFASTSPSPSPQSTLKDLESIGITSDWDSYAFIPPLPFDYALFDEALKAVVWFCRWRYPLVGNRGGGGGEKTKNVMDNLAKETSENMKDINITLQFICQWGITEWFASHLSADLHSTSVLTELTHISTLSFSGCWSLGFKQATVDILPEWLGLVCSGSGSALPDLDQNPSSNSHSHPSRNPGLHTVKFVEMRDVQHALETQDFLFRVAERCVPLGLRWLVVGALIGEKAFDLVKVREEGLNLEGEV